MDTNKFSAPGAALGYLAQVEYGLVYALRRMDEQVIDLAITIETADDLVFEIEDDPSFKELWQTKHHKDRSGSLGDASPDIWKTIHNWIETSTNEALILLSTSAATVNSAAWMLSFHVGRRNVESACVKLVAVAIEHGNGALASYYDRFLALTDTERISLLGRVVVIDEAVSSEDITAELLRTTRKAVQDQTRRIALVERLRGWWHGRVITHLNAVALGRADKIQLSEIEDRLHYFSQSLRDENLPLDFELHPWPTLQDVADDQRVFVEQLRLIMLHSDRIRQAVYDHNRAFLQRSKWQRERLLNLDELKIYDRRLIEEWSRFFLPIGSEDAAEDEDEKRARARETFVRFEQRELPELRKEMHSRYVPIGSLHILADEFRIGWHPQWVDLLHERLSELGHPLTNVGSA